MPLDTQQEDSCQPAWEHLGTVCLSQYVSCLCVCVHVCIRVVCIHVHRGVRDQHDIKYFLLAFHLMRWGLSLNLDWLVNLDPKDTSLSASPALGS